MSVQVRRFIIMVVALGMLSVALVACQATAITPPGSGNSGQGSTLTFATAAANAVSPTPTFPVFTIGAWPSNYSPGNPDTITIYVICRVQDPTMKSPAVPPNPGVTTTIFVEGAVNQTFTATTGSDGIATAQVAFSDPNPGVPVVVQVSATYNGQTYKNQTFFTPGATFTPTPAGGPNVTPGTTPGTTPSTGP
ncbi:MAG: hypothetical protein ACRDID_23440 [Ktedonobacterales bacterium]